MADTQAPTARKIAAPQGNPETKPFWDAALEGRFLIKRCTACGKAHYYPRSLCPLCGSEETVWEEASGRGEIYTLSVTYRGTPEPYAIGYVELEEGPRILTNFTGAALESFGIGDKVKLVWTPTEGGPPVPMFGPA